MQTKDILKELRKSKGYSNMKDFCEAFDISFSTYQNYEAGKRTPTADVLIKLADFYDVTVDYLLGREDDLLDFLSLSEDDKNLEEKIGAMLLKFYRSVPAGIRKEFLSDARKLFEACKEEFYDQPKESSMEYVGTVGDFLKSQQMQEQETA